MSNTETGPQLTSRATGRPEDMRIGGKERRGAEWEALACLDHESGLLDPARRVARQVTAAGDMRPEGSVSESLKA